jgi:hypothetical protein
MPQFNLNDYETVEERIKRFYKDNPDGRIITENLTTAQDRQVSTWVVKSFVFLSAADQEKNLPKATGLAFEVDSVKGPTATSGLEVCETSSIGRSLANAGYSGNRRASREEMAKVERGVKPSSNRNWVAEIEKLETIESARQLYNEARTQKAPTAVLDDIKAKVASFGTLPTT